jgi:type IV pilus assembly protein PilC
VPSYQYKAIDQLGRPAQGHMEALNEIDLELRLKHIGLDMLTFKQTANATSINLSSRVSTKDLMMFCFHLEQLTSAGVPLLDGLADLRESTANPHLKRVVGGVINEIEGGKMLSQALGEFPSIFDGVFVNLIKAGEQTGRLPEVFSNLADSLRWQDELKAQTQRLLMYPAFTFVVVIGAVAFLMMYLVPQIASLLVNMGIELPFSTKAMIWLSEVFVKYWGAILGVPVIALIGGFILLKKSDNARYRMDYLLLNIPVIGDIMKKLLLARFARYFALMYQTGIPVLDAIKTCENIMGNQVVANALNRAHNQINAGDSMSESFASAGLFPPLVVRMIKVGENTGGLDRSLLKISYFYDRDVNEAIQKMLALLEPALTVFLGLILGIIMVSVLGPVYDSFSKLNI